MDETAFDIIRKTLEYYGLKDAAFLKEVETLFARKVISDRSTVDDIGIVMKDSQAFADRFPANKELAAAGKQQYSVSQYLTLEADFISRLKAAGMPQGFYDNPKDLQKLIAGGVSPNELSGRIELGYQAVKNAPKEVVDQFKNLYGVSEGDLAAYFIDPEVARPTFDKYEAERQARAAQIAAQGVTQANMQLDKAAAEELARAGIQPGEAQKGFAELGATQELFNPMTVGETAITQQEQIAGTFGTNAAAAQRIATRKAKRKAEFEAGGSLAETQQGVTGLRTVGQ